MSAFFNALNDLLLSLTSQANTLINVGIALHIFLFVIIHHCDQLRMHIIHKSYTPTLQKTE